MNLVDTFASPFKLVYHHQYRDPCDGLRTKYRTNNIYDETTKEEIYIISKMYFDNFVSTYKIYHLHDRPATESSYRLYVEQVEDYELTEKHIYSMAYNNIEDKMSWENKYDGNFPIEGRFRIVIDVTAYRFEDYDEDDEYEEYEVKKSIKEDECVVCYENKPNVLYTECLHFAVCDSCDKNGYFTKCPMCRKKINNQRILFS